MSKLNQLVVLRNVVLDNWNGERKFFLGKILTIIDATISDQEQRKGIKDLIKQSYYEKNYSEEVVRQHLIDFAKVHSPHLVSDNFSEDDFMGKIGQEIPYKGEPLFYKE